VACSGALWVSRSALRVLSIVDGLIASCRICDRRWVPVCDFYCKQDIQIFAYLMSISHLALYIFLSVCIHLWPSRKFKSHHYHHSFFSLDCGPSRECRRSISTILRDPEFDTLQSRLVQLSLPQTFFRWLVITMLLHAPHLLAQSIITVVLSSI